jgi:hypothetical protein
LQRRVDNTEPVFQNLFTRDSVNCFRLLLHLLPKAADGAANSYRRSGIQSVGASCLHLKYTTRRLILTQENFDKRDNL